MVLVKSYNKETTSVQTTTKAISPEIKQPLYCYSCNSNADFCAPESLNLTRLNIEHYVPCNGQCMQYRNKNDDYSKNNYYYFLNNNSNNIILIIVNNINFIILIKEWYRGCSWEMDFGNGVATQPSRVEYKGNVYYFCNTNGYIKFLVTKL